MLEFGSEWRKSKLIDCSAETFARDVEETEN